MDVFKPFVNSNDFLLTTTENIRIGSKHYIVPIIQKFGPVKIYA